MTFEPRSVEVTCTLPKDNNVTKSYENTSQYVETVTLFFKKIEPKVTDPWMTFDPKSVEVTCVTLPKDHCVQVPWKYIKVCGYRDPFYQKLELKVIDPRWPLIPHLLQSHVWLSARIIVSKSHGNTPQYVDTVINFSKYHIHTTYYVQNEWSHSLFLNTVAWTQFRRDKNGICFITWTCNTHLQ